MRKTLYQNIYSIYYDSITFKERGKDGREGGIKQAKSKMFILDYHEQSL